MIDTEKYEGHMNGYYFEGSNFDMEHLTMYDSDGNELGVLKSNNKTLMEGIPFVSPTIEIMCDAPLLLAEVKRLYALIFHVYHKLEYCFGDDDPFVKNLDLLENMYNRGEEE